MRLKREVNFKDLEVYKKGCPLHPGPALQTSLILSLLVLCAILNMSPHNVIIIFVSTLVGVVILCSVVVFLCRCLRRRNDESATTVSNTQAQVPPGQQAQQPVQNQQLQLPPNSQLSQQRQQDEQGTDNSQRLPGQNDAASFNVGHETANQDGISGSSIGGQSSSLAQQAPAFSGQQYQELRDLGVSPPQEPDNGDQLSDQIDSATANVGSDTTGQDSTSGGSEGGESRSQAQQSPAAAGQRSWKFRLAGAPLRAP